MDYVESFHAGVIKFSADSTFCPVVFIIHLSILHLCSRVYPFFSRSLVIHAINLPNTNGIALINQIPAKFNEIRFVYFSVVQIYKKKYQQKKTLLRPYQPTIDDLYNKIDLSTGIRRQSPIDNENILMDSIQHVSN